MLEITNEVLKKAVYKNYDITVYPYVCVSIDMPLLVYAVFKVVCHNLGDKFIPFVIFGNRMVAPLEEGWQEVFDKFLLFAKKNHMKSNDMVGSAFFKKSNEEYTKSNISCEIDLLPIIEKILEHNRNKEID